jgi:hypothetical protein
MSEETNRIGRGMVLKVGTAAAGAILANIVAQEPADATLPINLWGQVTGTTGPAQAISRPKSHAAYNTVTLYMWENGSTPVVQPPSPTDQSVTFLFDNRTSPGGYLRGCYCDDNNPEKTKVKHPKLYVVITT